jgi:hypothetical protein
MSRCLSNLIILSKKTNADIYQLGINKMHVIICKNPIIEKIIVSFNENYLWIFMED